MAELSAHTAGGQRLAVTVLGEGPPLLMIPGLGSARRVYDPIVPALAERATVIVYDPRGIGESELPPGGSDMATLADDAVRVLDAVGVSRADVWGASMGGMVAQHVALRHPDRVDRLLLAATTAGGPNAVQAPAAHRAALLGRGARNPADAYRLACTVLYAPDFQEAAADFIDAEVARRGNHPVRPQAFLAQRQATLGHDTWAELPSLRLPVLVTHGTEDAVQPLANGVALAERIPGAAHHWFEGRGHLFFHEVPVETVAVVEEFLSGTPRREDSA